MKLKTKELTDALTRLKPIISRRNTLPILSCVKIHSELNRIHFTASDLDQFQVEKIECDGEFAPCCVSYGALLNAIGGETTDLRLSKSILVVSCDFGTTELDILDAEEYPPIPKCDGMKNIGVSCEDLSRAIGATLWAAHDDPSRYILQSVHVMGRSKLLHVEATNGRELGIIDQPLISGDFDIVVPSGFAGGFAEILLRKGADLSVNEKYIKVTHEFGAYFAKQIDGVYPNTEQVIPAKQKKIGDMDVEAMRDIFSRCNFFSDPSRTPIAQMTFSAEGVEVEFTGRNSNLDLRAPGKFGMFQARVNAESFHRCLTAIKSPRAIISCDAGEEKFPILVLQSGDLFIYTTQVAGDFQSKPKAEKEKPTKETGKLL
jgi:DNA polymerase III sliding clamp (beta) subunit (PCNA family)